MLLVRVIARIWRGKVPEKLVQSMLKIPNLLPCCTRTWMGQLTSCFPEEEESTQSFHIIKAHGPGRHAGRIYLFLYFFILVMK